MQFRENADVFSADGEKVGEIDRVILDPEDKEITHVVVQQGFLFTTDKVVPAHLIEEATEEQVTLSVEVGELEELPDFEESHFVPVNEAEFARPTESNYAPPLFWYPPPGAGWGTAGSATIGTGAPAVPPFMTAEEGTPAPAGMTVLNEGATVVSMDGENVGSVEAILTDPEENRATHLVIGRGVLLTEEKCIPTSWISTVMQDEVRLTVGSETLKDLEDYEGEC
jgi:uncharacterized protein YrrD